MGYVIKWVVLFYYLQVKLRYRRSAPYPINQYKWGAHLPFLGLVLIGDKPLKSMINVKKLSFYNNV